MKKNKNYPLFEAEPLQTIKELLTVSNERYGDRIAVKYEQDKKDYARTYKEFYLDTLYLGTALTGLGYEHKHIACIGNNSYEWLVVYLCVLSSNNVFVPIDKDLPAGDIMNVINHSDADIVFCDKKYEAVFAENRGMAEKEVEFVSFGDEDADGYMNFRKLLADGKEKYDDGDMSFINQMPNNVNSLKGIVYTSGTTGLSKGVMLSEKNYVSCIYYGLMLSTVRGECLSVLPYHHTYESVCGVLVALRVGNTICINKSLKGVVRSLKKYKPSYIMLVPAFANMFYAKIQKNIKASGKDKAFNMLVKISNVMRKIGIDKRKVFFKEIREVFGGNMEKLICGGAPIRPEVGDFFDDIGITILSGYGITECSPLVSCNRDYFNDCATVGVPLSCIEVKIDSPDKDGIGEIKVKGDTVMMGYYKAGDLTKEVMRDGWFYTGDYGKYNEKGQLMITGRKKNLIVLSNGKNVFPEEIEEYISSIPEVSEVLVYSKKNAEGNEKGLTAAVYLDPDTPIYYDELRAKISAVLAPLPMYKQIHEIIIKETPFEKTTSNKIKRQQYINN